MNPGLRDVFWMRGVVGSLLLGASLARAEPPKKAAPEPTAAELIKQAKEQLIKVQLAEAEATTRACVQKYPAEAHCHLLLGSTLARRSQVDQAAKEYREFLRLAPNDFVAPTIRTFLADYEKSRSDKK